MARLDIYLVTPDIHAKISRHFNSFGYRSDHSFIGIELNVENIQHGKGFWKFNSALLQDQDYVKLVKMKLIM